MLTLKLIKVLYLNHIDYFLLFLFRYQISVSSGLRLLVIERVELKYIMRASGEYDII